MDFNFDDWAIKIGLKPNTIIKLREEDIDSLEVLLCLTNENVDQLQISLGQPIVLKSGIDELKLLDLEKKSSMRRTKYEVEVSEVSGQKKLKDTSLQPRTAILQDRAKDNNMEPDTILLDNGEEEEQCEEVDATEKLSEKSLRRQKKCIEKYAANYWTATK